MVGAVGRERDQPELGSAVPTPRTTVLGCRDRGHRYSGTYGHSHLGIGGQARQKCPQTWLPTSRYLGIQDGPTVQPPSPSGFSLANLALISKAPVRLGIQTP